MKLLSFPVKKEWLNKTLTEIDFRANYGINIIAIKHGEQPYIVEIDGNLRLQDQDELLGVVKDETLRRLFKG